MESAMSYSLFAAEDEFVIEAESSLTDRYQTTVPETVRRALKLTKRDRIHYKVKSTGEVVMERAVPDSEEDPAFGPFLDFLARDIEQHPRDIRSFSPDFLQRVQSLTKDVEIDLDAELSPDDE
ncbi:type II toxin-antitoxin system PrlF family antitoxin [Paraburkholderia sabiae]|uniref:Type II toxin-antitoxin system PrlF family antitoxin n=1 Tax=Paraburkholderia sabiae TaxID=273251 RepID=A0ABU9QDA4_9BURK|nr:type II toxin-antitoxin system PrlF family antitoxin [Paraburkholderia sabiae]WJZ76105.1 type II toxin-antitoxin system PrlF family antitoxin [Paraburkholderia sabiae]